ncbi:MAG: hypothetical protein ACHREM_23130 [Polyangiales bacterium]
MVHGSKLYRTLISSAAALSILTIGASALAADDDDDKKEEETPKPKPRKRERERAPEARGDTDHSAVVGHMGVGYFGTVSAFGAAAGATGSTVKAIDIPIIGMRYWLQDALGLDIGVGLTHTSGSASTSGNSADLASTTGFALYGGIPIVFFTAKHYNFFLEPYIAIAHGSFTPAAPTTESDSSTVLKVGGKIGTEISFGFIGIPHLSLDATVGLEIISESDTNSPGGGAADNSLSQVTIGTTVQGTPWNIFTSSIAALYYF